MWFENASVMMDRRSTTNNKFYIIISQKLGTSTIGDIL